MQRKGGDLRASRSALRALRSHFWEMTGLQDELALMDSYLGLAMIFLQKEFRTWEYVYRGHIRGAVNVFFFVPFRPGLSRTLLGRVSPFFVFLKTRYTRYTRCTCCKLYA